MDWLAATGTRYANAYTPCPVCSPARASFWTGKIPSAHGIHDHIAAPDHPGLDGQENLAGHLQAAGYRTGLCGKWHGHKTGKQPQPGFDFWFSQWGGTNARFGDQPFSENGERREHHGHQAPVVTDAAIRFLRGQTTDADPAPFFLFVGYTETHSPFSTLPERLVAPHRAEQPPAIRREPFESIHGTASTPAPEQESEYREQLAQYLASAEMIDAHVGLVIDELENLGLLENTLIVYTSDHGHMNGQHGLLCKGNATTPQNFLEESIRIPMLIRPPAGLDQGAVSELKIDHCDLHATLLDAAGLEVRAQRGIPGRSILDPAALAEWRTDQICEYGNARMILSGDGLKLIRRYPGPNGHFGDECYDLPADPRETRNVIDQPEYAERIAALDLRLEAWFSEHEIEGHEGRTVGEKPPFNPNEPWRRS